ncbi:MAG: NAD-dependent protein deacylase [Planctomycetes bacterium]|nr:NAD-dependent protein deacylase [Planctomycetota bacterium]MDP7246782.1 NAD-dependent deacylase [Planctomycetota bacterium]
MRQPTSPLPKSRIVVLSGAGMSAESGLQTFRASDGLWEEHRVEDVATPDAWDRDPELVLRFYNERRRGVLAAEPNAGHLALVKLEEKYEVHIITQNIDNLHERAGSKQVLHLHGKIMESRSTADDSRVYDNQGQDINLGDTCELGSQLRPNIVWFGEAVPMMDQAAPLVAIADYVLVVGTSLVVYPAAGLVQFAPENAKIFVVDPASPKVNRRQAELVAEKAAVALPPLVERLLGVEL